MNTHFDYLIVGAGPAGLQLGYFLERAGRNYLILEAGEGPGTFFKQFPRHRKLISINKVYNGYEDPELSLRWDWNSLLSDDLGMLFKFYSKEYFPSADALVKYLADFAEHFALNIKYNAKVVHISKEQLFHVQDQDGNVYTSNQVIISTGVTKSYQPTISGIELVEDYSTVSVDPEDFINQKVLVIGKGNSAFETADNLISTTALIHIASPNPLKMAWRTHFVGNLRAINNNLLDTYQLKSQNAILDASIEKIERVNGKYAVLFNYTHAHGEKETLCYDRVITCTGFCFDASIFDEDCRPELTINNRFPLLTNEWESVNVPGLYFGGTITQSLDYRKSTSGFIHGFRYNILALHRILEQKYEAQVWTHRAIPATAQGLTDAVIGSVNRTSALWQQFGFLCDMIVVPEDGSQAYYYETLPYNYVLASEFGKADHYYLITLEYGANHDAHDPFNVTRIARDSVDQAQESNFLHPVIRHFSGAHKVSEHHIIEDLAAEWLEDVHIQPLVRYFAHEMAKPKPFSQNGHMQMASDEMKPEPELSFA